MDITEFLPDGVGLAESRSSHDCILELISYKRRLVVPAVQGGVEVLESWVW
jgi:hypothetical protein